METPSPESSSESTSRAKGRARERHERRKERQGGMVQPAGSARKQLRPTGSFKMPEIHLPLNRLVIYGAAGAVFLIMVVLVLGRLKNNNAPLVGTNAIWIDNAWTQDSHTDSEVEGLAQTLRDHQIGTVYAWVSLLQPDDAWTDTIKLNQVKAFAQQFKRLYPQAKLYGWLSIGSQGADGNNRLGDTKVQQMVADFSQRVIGDFQFDGVMLNIVPVSDGDEHYLEMLRKVRAVVGETGLMAVAVPPDWTPTDANVPTPTQIKPGTVWQKEYKQRIALLADQIVVTAYNSGLQSAADYSAWIAYQVQSFTQAVAELENTTEILIGVPTYEPQLPMHDPAVENVAAAITGVQAGLKQTGKAATFIKGLAIFGEWNTTLDDWTQIATLWGS